MRGCIAALHTNGATLRTDNTEEVNLESNRNGWAQNPSAFSQLNPIRSDSGVSDVSEKMYVSTSEASEHVDKRSATALGQSLTNGAAVQFGRIRESAIIEL